MQDDTRQPEKLFLVQSYTVLCLVTSGEALGRMGRFTWLPLKSIPRLSLWATGRDNSSPGGQAAASQVTAGLHWRPRQHYRDCGKESWHGRPSSLAGVSRGFVQNHAAPTAVLCERERVERLNLPFAELVEKVTGEMWLCGFSDLLQS